MEQLSLVPMWEYLYIATAQVHWFLIKDKFRSPLFPSK